MPQPPLDEFGIPTGIDKDESLRDELWRRAQVKFAGEIALARLFGRLRFHLGLHDAQNMLRPFMRKQQGRPKGSGNKDKNLMILALYQEYLQQDASLTKEEIGEKIYDGSRKHAINLGNSPKAIAEQIGALLKAERKKNPVRSGRNQDGSDTDEPV